MPSECYRCGGVADTVDHIPPKCFFPKWKNLESGQAILRHQLLTLPACTECNGGRSADDELALDAISKCIRGNEVGMLHGRERLLKQLAGSPAAAEKLKSVVKPLDFYGVETATFETNGNRVRNWAREIARGLWYFDHSFRPVYDVRASIEELRDDQGKKITETEIFNHLVDEALDGVPLQGSNPEVFLYRTKRTDSNLIADMWFYGSFRICAASLPGIEPD